jgi:hypothetical protein
VITVIIVYFSAIVLTSLLARTPLAVPLTGRKQVPLSTLIPPQWRPRHDDAAAVQDTDVLDDRIAAEPGIGEPDLKDTGLAADGLASGELISGDRHSGDRHEPQAAGAAGGGAAGARPTALGGHD